MHVMAGYLCVCVCVCVCVLCVLTYVCTYVHTYMCDYSCSKLESVSPATAVTRAGTYVCIYCICLAYSACTCSMKSVWDMQINVLIVCGCTGCVR